MSAGPPTCRARHSVSAVWRCEVRSLLDQGLGGKQDKAGTSAVPALAARALALAGSWKAGKTHGLSASLFQSLSDQDGSSEVNRCVFRPPETQGLGGGLSGKGGAGGFSSLTRQPLSQVQVDASPYTRSPEGSWRSSPFCYCVCVCVCLLGWEGLVGSCTRQIWRTLQKLTS